MNTHRCPFLGHLTPITSIRKDLGLDVAAIEVIAVVLVIDRAAVDSSGIALAVGA